MNFPLAVSGSSYWVCSRYATAIIQWGRDFLLLCLYRDGVHLHTTAAKTKPNLSVNEFVSKVLEFVHPLRCSSNWCVAHYTGSVMCRLISYSLLHSVKLSLGIKKLLTNTNQLLHTASWGLMVLLWHRETQDKRLVSCFTVKLVSLQLVRKLPVQFWRA